MFGQTLAADAAADLGQVELIFPQNTTYQPTPLIPVVFSVKNPKLINKLYPSLSFSVWRTGSNSSVVKHDLPIRRLNPENDTSFLYQGIADLASSAGELEISWALRWINCSRSSDGSDFDDANTPEDQDDFHRRTYWPRKTLSFSIGSADDQAVDLQTLDCHPDSPEQQGFAFRAKDQNLEVPLGLSADGVSSCVLLASPAPTVGPICQATSLGSDVASSISASMTKMECGQATPAVTCPPDEESAGSSLASHYQASRSVGLLLISLAYICLL